MRNLWTNDEVEILSNYYATHGVTYCANILNRNNNSVSRKANRVGLKVNEEVSDMLKKEGISNSNRPDKKDRLGEKFKTYQGYEVEVVEYLSSTNCTVKFNDKRNTIRKNVAVKELKSGSVKNYYHPEVLGVGYIGVGNYTARVDGKMTKCYNTWFNMLSRCYQSTNNRNATYCNVEVCEEWHNFQNFAQWFYNTCKDNSWHLDKDILCPTCKIYSPETCCFVPNEVNCIFKKNNESTYDLPKGVYPKDGKYESAISKFNKQHYIGLYKTIEEAHSAYKKAKKEHFIEISENWRNILPDSVCDAIRDFDISLL